MDNFKNIKFDILNNSQEEPQNGKDENYWRGFKELYNDPSFEKAKSEEFAGGFENENAGSGFSRRKFIALMGLSAAFAAAGCANYKNKGDIVPYNKRPEDMVPGIPDFYSSTCNACQDNCGILIKTREGRPIKIDGNPDHPVSKGKLCARGQANIMNLYDPGRLTEPQLNQSNKFQKLTWEEADAKIVSALKASAGAMEIAVIANKINSPTYKKLIEDFSAMYPGTKVYSYELFNQTNAKEAFNKSYGKENLPVVNLNEAEVILSLESDFLSSEVNKVENIRLFTQSREVIGKEKINRFYAVEGNATLTGFNADYRIRLRTDAIEEFVLSLINEILITKKVSKYSADANVINAVKQYSIGSFITKYKLDKKVIESLVSDLIKNLGKSYVSAGSQLPESTHIAVNFLNEILGNTKIYSRETSHTDLIPLSSKKDLKSLVERLNLGAVGCVIILDSNPVYHFPAELNFAQAIGKAKIVISLSEYHNETTSLSSVVLPINHTLESWGDYKSRTGFYSFQQPVIAPLHNTRQKEAVMLNWMSANTKDYKEENYLFYLKAHWEKTLFPTLNHKLPFREFWVNALHDGVVKTNEKVTETAPFKTESFSAAIASSKFKASSDFVILLHQNPFLGDGRFAVNGWMQELPHPVSKIVWDNYAAISPETAKANGIASDDVIEINIDGRTIKIPAFVQPGMADNVIAIDLGYGRKNSGKIAQDIGINANELISYNNFSDLIYNNGKIAKTGKTYELVSTQEHYPIDDERYKDIHLKRKIIREGTVEEYKKEPGFLEKEKPFPSMYPDHEYPGVKWGMAIDLNKCIGCAECVASCNVENNIPIVGKEQVKANREMQWIRIDRYYSGTPQEPKASFQPMMCSHCDLAPCENVCPVAATTHSPDGLNGMAYNRCVGTRYCSNNCPFKVRRFNFFNFRDHFEDSYYQNEEFNLLHNPEVTVRSRGVMEKCTFCVQRIMFARQEAVKQGKDIKGEDVKTACQEACPADAIVFGDMNDKKSELSKLREHNLGYTLLDEIKIRPNITYMAKLRNISEEKAEG